MPRLDIGPLRIVRLANRYVLGETKEHGPEHHRFSVTYRVRRGRKGALASYDVRRGIEGPIEGPWPTWRERMALEVRALPLLVLCLWEALTRPKRVRRLHFDLLRDHEKGEGQ